MAVLTNTMLQGTAADTGEESYQIEKSLRFNSVDTAKLTRTPGSEGNRRTWTWSGWVKRSKLGSDEAFFAGGESNPITTLRFRKGSGTDNSIYLFHYAGSMSWELATNAQYKDTSSWYHIVVAYDSTDATSSERVKLFVNGKQVTSFETASYPSQNFESSISDNVIQTIGVNGTASNYFNGYLTDVYFIDGLALSPAAFGSFDSTGVWYP